jgi:hypothetical protein
MPLVPLNLSLRKVSWQNFGLKDRDTISAGSSGESAPSAYDGIVGFSITSEWVDFDVDHRSDI